MIGSFQAYLFQGKRILAIYNVGIRSLNSGNFGEHFTTTPTTTRYKIVGEVFY